MATEDTISTVEGDGPPVLLDEIDTLNGVAQADPKAKAQRIKLGGGPDSVFDDAPFDPLYGLGVDVKRIQGAVDTELPAAAAPVDDGADPVAPAVVAHAMVYNGAAWEKERGNVDVGLWQGSTGGAPDGPRTSTFSGANQKNRTGRSIAVYLHISATPGTADTVKLRLAGRGKYGTPYPIWESPTYSAPGDHVFLLGPGVDPTYNPAAPAVVGGVAGVLIPALFFLSVVHSATGPSFAYDLAYSLVR